MTPVLAFVGICKGVGRIYIIGWLHPGHWGVRGQNASNWGVPTKISILTIVSIRNSGVSLGSCPSIIGMDSEASIEKLLTSCDTRPDDVPTGVISITMLLVASLMPSRTSSFCGGSSAEQNTTSC